MEVRDIIPWRRKNKEALAVRDDFEDIFTTFRREMDRVFDSFFEGLDLDLPRWSAPSFVPSVDVKETDEAFEVSAELPGMEEKDIELSLDENGLVLKGEKKFEKEEKGAGYHRVERRYGSFHRRIPIPAEVDQEKVEATFKNGVLHVTLPKVEAKKSKAIKIKVK